MEFVLGEKFMLTLISAILGMNMFDKELLTSSFFSVNRWVIDVYFSESNSGGSVDNRIVDFKI
jgi:hypothetical protein